MLSKKLALWSFAAMAVSLWSPVAYAQSAPADEEAANGLSEVIVTAERRATNLQETPISIVAFNANQLEALGADSLETLETFLPNVSIGGSVPNGAGSPDFSIRGVGQTSGRANSEKGVGLYIDDIYYPRATGSLLNLGDVQRIEVLRGPQGTLFGRNNTGGAIRYFTNAPRQGFDASLTATVGSRDRRDVVGMVNIPIGPDAALRLQGASMQRDGYIDVLNTGQTLGGQEDLALRGSFLVEPTDNLSIRLTAAYTHNESLGDPITISNVSGTLPIVQAYNSYLTSIGQPTVAVDDPRWVSPSAYSVYNNCILDDAPVVAANFGPAVTQLSNALALGRFCEERQEDESFFFSADISYDISENLSFRSLTGFISSENIDQGDYGLFGASVNSLQVETESWSQEFQLLGSYTDLDWVVGLYYFKETPLESTFNRQLIIAGPNLGRCCSGFDRTVDLTTESYAAFAQATWHATERLGFTLGARYTSDEKEAEVIKYGSYVPSIPNAFRAQTVSDSWDAVDWRATVDYQWTDSLMTYFTASRGFKSGGFNGDISVLPGPTYAVEPFDPEYVTNFEAGFRSEWFDRRLRVNATAFTMELEDLVVQFADFTGGGLTLRFLNAGTVQLSGLETEVQWVPFENFSVNFSGGYTDLEYDTLGDNSPLFRAGVGTCPAAPATRTFALCGANAQPLTRTPELTYTVGLSYDIPLSDGRIRSNINYAYRDEIWSGNSTSNAILLPDYGVANLRLAYESNSFWEVALSGANIFDELYYTSGFDGRGPNNPVATVWRSPAPGAEWALSVTVRY